MKLCFKHLYLPCMILSVLLLASSCSMMNSIVEPSTDITLNTSKDINPDKSNRSSPVIIKIFELSSRSLFDTQDFFSLYSSASSILGPDLISELELELEPKQTKTIELKLNNNTRYVGIIVAYQDIDNSSWRKVIEVDPKAYDSFSFNIEKLALYQE